MSFIDCRKCRHGLEQGANFCDRCGTAIGDLDGLARQNNGTGALNITNFPHIDYSTGYLHLDQSNLRLESLNLTSEVNTNFAGVIDISAADQQIIGCSVVSDRNGAGGNERAIYAGGESVLVYDCDLESQSSNSGNNVIRAASNKLSLVHTRITGDQGEGLLASFSTLAVIHCVFHDINDDAIRLGSTVPEATIIGNTFYNIGGDCIESLAAVTSHTLISGNVAWICDRFYNQLTATEPALLIDNAAGSFGTGRLANVSDWDELRAITLTTNPFVDPANGDFQLNAEEGGGALCLDVGASGGDLGAIQQGIGGNIFG